MNDTPMTQEIEAARAYEALFVPALFRQWATPLLDLARVATGDRVLDVACGTGILAREAQPRAAPCGLVVGLDATGGMLEVARELAPEILWRQGDAQQLPFEDEAFDAVLCQFGLMFFIDPRAALGEMHRVLVPAGRLAVAVFEGLDGNPTYAREVALLERIAGPAAAEALRAPFVLGDAAALSAMAREAGFEDVAVTTRQGIADFPSITSLLEADLRGWLPVMGVHLDEATIQRVLSEAQVELGDVIDPRGRAVFEVSAHLLSARRN
ncbi:methyltransferase domain-containing protein [Halomonas saccharevitans]|uniref:Methyltransferase domain-containing protein n=1 Tax=Halomonas saccharevitans TaxID=416872 RepID=A0ABU3NC56_9GAMM|nr:methyltransferase domain-containing protein [Halomonas saccharevitans]MDT8878751.1 methyltransferase domain-containing protein [Halomonas saccharevitans]